MIEYYYVNNADTIILYQKNSYNSRARVILKLEASIFKMSSILS